jgi:N4-gp56 family major capsid protein
MKTEFGTNHPLAVKLWSESLFRESLKRTWIGRFIGKGKDNVIQLLPDTGKSAGDRVTVGLRMQLNGAGVSGDATLEGNEENLVFYSDSLLINQLRHATRSSGKASEQRVPYSMREEGRDALADWWAARYDTWFFNQICGVIDQTDVRFTGMQPAVAPTTAASAADGISRMIIGGGHTTEASLSPTTSHAITLRDLDAAVARAKNMSPMIRPIMINGEEHYVAFLHEYQIYQLRGQASAGQWADIQKAVLQSGKVNDNPIFTGAAGMYNRVIIHEANRVPYIDDAFGPNYIGYRRGVFCGAQAAAIAFGRGDGPNRFSWNEELFDYGNQLGIGAGAIAGLKKLQFNGTDFGTITLSGYAPQP